MFNLEPSSNCEINVMVALKLVNLRWIVRSFDDNASIFRELPISFWISHAMFFIGVDFLHEDKFKEVLFVL